MTIEGKSAEQHCLDIYSLSLSNIASIVLDEILTVTTTKECVQTCSATDIARFKREAAGKRKPYTLHNGASSIKKVNSTLEPIGTEEFDNKLKLSLIHRSKVAKTSKAPTGKGVAKGFKVAKGYLRGLLGHTGSPLSSAIRGVDPGVSLDKVPRSGGRSISPNRRYARKQHVSVKKIPLHHLSPLNKTASGPKDKKEGLEEIRKLRMEKLRAVEEAKEAEVGNRRLLDREEEESVGRLEVEVEGEEGRIEAMTGGNEAVAAYRQSP